MSLSDDLVAHLKDEQLLTQAVGKLLAMSSAMFAPLHAGDAPQALRILMKGVDEAYECIAKMQTVAILQKTQ